MPYKVITAPTVEPITVAQARMHLRADGVTADDPDLQLKISAAREYIESYLNKAIAEQTVEIAYDSFPFGAIQLDGGQVTSIVSVKYLDYGNVLQTIVPANYVLDDYSVPNWLLMNVAYYWPTSNAVANAIKVRYIIGMAPALVPAAIKSALLLMVGHLYGNREAVTEGAPSELPLGVKSLLDPHRIGLGV